MKWSANDSAVLYSASRQMMLAGFSELKPKGQYLVCSATNSSSEAPHIGQLRISFEFDKCAAATVVA